VIELLVSEGKLFLRPLNLVHQLALVKRLLGDNLSAQILDLCRQALFDCIVLFTHDFAPDSVEIVKNLADTSLAHTSVELFFDLENGADSLRWDPVIVLGLLFAALWPALRRLISC